MNKINSVIGDESDLICIDCHKQRKMKASCYCLDCKIKREPDYLARKILKNLNKIEA